MTIFYVPTHNLAFVVQ